MSRVLRAFASILAWAIAVPFALWAGTALWIDGPGGAWRFLTVALLVGAIGFLLLRLPRACPRWVAVGFPAAAVLAWWLTLAASNERPWAPEYSRAPAAVWNGNRVTVQNVRNFHYRSETDFDVRYEDRTYDLDRLRAVDLYLNTWGSPHIAHAMLSFVFDDGTLPLCFSIETRREKGEIYSALLGFFRQFELIYVAGDERDLVKLRTNHRKELVRLYRLRTPPKRGRQILRGYLASVNQLSAHPAWYNAATTNCTTDAVRHFSPVAWDSYHDAPCATPWGYDHHPWGAVVHQMLSGDTGTIVGTYEFSCSSQVHNAGFQTLGSMHRYETRGDGPQRTFYYGGSGGSDPGSTVSYPPNAWGPVYNPPEADPQWNGYITLPYKLGRVTDWNNAFTQSRYFRYTGYQIWKEYDFLANPTLAEWQSSPPLVTKITHPDGSSRSWDYTNAGASDPLNSAAILTLDQVWLFSKTDELGNVTTYTRDSLRRVRRIDYPGGASETIAYNNLNQVVSHVLPTGSTTTITYDAFNRQTSVVDSTTGERTDYTYYDAADGHPDWIDLVKTVTDGRARQNGAPYTVKMEYNARHQVTKVHHAATGNSPDPFVTYVYDNYGNCTQITDELGHWKNFAFDEYRRCTAYTESLTGAAWNAQGWVATRTWNWYYDRFNTVNGVLCGFPPSSHIDGQWRIAIGPAFDKDGNRKMSVQYFDANNRVTAVQTGWTCSPSNVWTDGADGETHSVSYDANGNKLSVTDPLGRVTTMGYDNRNRATRVTDPLNHSTYTAYDVANNKTQVTLPDSNLQRWQNYDAFGQAGTFIDERNNVTNVTYLFGPMKKIGSVTTYRDKDGGGTENQPTTFQYDGLGRETLRTFPDQTSEQNWWGYGGELYAHRMRRGAIKHLDFDSRHRERSNWWDAGSDVPNETRVWDDAGRLTSVSNAVSTIDYGYDEASQVFWEGNTIAGSGGRVQTVYYRYPDGGVAHLSYPNGFWTRRDYNARGELVRLGSDDGAGNWGTKTDFAYYADGKPWHTDYPNGFSSTFVYDGGGRVVSTNTSNGNGSYASRTYTRDNRDRITSITKGGASSLNPLENSRGDRFVYDAEGQLTDAWYDAQNPAGTITGWAREDHFVYDALGNRKGNDWLANKPGWAPWTRRDNGLNQVQNWAGGGAANWDDLWNLGNGVLVQDGNFSTWYDALNRPIWYWTSAVPSGTEAHLAYDPLGRCVKRWTSPSADVTSNPATYLYYDGWSLIQEGSSAASVSQIYLHGPRIDQIIARYNYGQNQWYYHHYDARTHCILITNGGGTVTEQYAYDAFGWAWVYNASGVLQNPSVNGVLQPARPASGNRFLFTGREWMADWGVYDYRHRHYHPLLGRFMQPDPKHFGAGDYNLYRYCHNDPINKVDPSGLAPTVIFKAIKWIYKGAKKIGFKSTGTLTEKQALRHRVSGKDVLIEGNSKKTAENAAKTLEEKAINARGQQVKEELLHHPKDAHVKSGNQPHFQSDNAGGHLFYRAASVFAATTYLGDNLLGNTVDFFNPLSAVKDVMDIADDVGLVEMQPREQIREAGK